MAFSFEPFLAISAGHFMAVSAGPEHCRKMLSSINQRLLCDFIVQRRRCPVECAKKRSLDRQNLKSCFSRQKNILKSCLNGSRFISKSYFSGLQSCWKVMGKKCAIEKPLQGTQQWHYIIRAPDHSEASVKRMLLLLEDVVRVEQRKDDGHHICPCRDG